MSSIEFKNKLYQKLSMLQVFKDSGNGQVSIRCPFCGDSTKNENSTHFGIKIDTRDTEPVLFHCLRADCQASGVLTPSLLRTLKINDSNLNSSLLAYNNRTMKSISKQLGITNNNFRFTIPPVIENELSIKKRDYINGRLGLKLSFEEMVSLKVIFNFPQFLHHNGVESLTVGTARAKLLHENYVGFLSARNEFINFRNIGKNSYLRYDKMSIYKGLDNTRKFYIIPNEIDLLSTEPITVNIAEGTFDIFGVYFHVYNQQRKNTVYAAVNGAAFTSVIKYIIQIGIIGNVNVNIFSDSGVDISYYKNMIKELQPWVNEFNVYYNEIMKNGKSDYGVKSYEIKLKKGRT